MRTTAIQNAQTFSVIVFLETFLSEQQWNSFLSTCESLEQPILNGI